MYNFPYLHQVGVNCCTYLYNIYKKTLFGSNYSIKLFDHEINRIRYIASRQLKHIWCGELTFNAHASQTGAFPARLPCIVCIYHPKKSSISGDFWNNTAAIQKLGYAHHTDRRWLIACQLMEYAFIRLWVTPVLEHLYLDYREFWGIEYNLSNNDYKAGSVYKFNEMCAACSYLDDCFM